jgi:hypothetical protein
MSKIDFDKEWRQYIEKCGVPLEQLFPVIYHNEVKRIFVGGAGFMLYALLDAIANSGEANAKDVVERIEQDLIEFWTRQLAQANAKKN